MTYVLYVRYRTCNSGYKRQNVPKHNFFLFVFSTHTHIYKIMVYNASTSYTQHFVRVQDLRPHVWPVGRWQGINKTHAQTQDIPDTIRNDITINNNSPPYRVLCTYAHRISRSEFVFDLHTYTRHTRIDVRTYNCLRCMHVCVCVEVYLNRSCKPFSSTTYPPLRKK